MKTIKFLSLIFAATAVLMSCSSGDDDSELTPPTPPTPTTEKGKYLTRTCDMTADASETTITLTGLSAEVTQKRGSASWLTITLQPYTSGTPEVTVACTQNLDKDARQQDVTFYAAKDTLVLTVHQEAYTGGGTDVDNINDTPTDQPAYARTAK